MIVFCSFASISCFHCLQEVYKSSMHLDPRLAHPRGIEPADLHLLLVTRPRPKHGCQAQRDPPRGIRRGPQPLDGASSSSGQHPTGPRLAMAKLGSSSRSSLTAFSMAFSMPSTCPQRPRNAWPTSLGHRTAAARSQELGPTLVPRTQRDAFALAWTSGLWKELKPQSQGADAASRAMKAVENGSQPI